jgi:HEAT repeat protein
MDNDRRESGLSAGEIRILLQREYSRHGEFVPGRKPPYPPLEKALEPRSCKIRLAAVIELSSKREKENLPILRSAAWDWYVPVRALAVRALEALGEPSPKQMLISLAESGGFRERFDAIRVLALLRDKTLAPVFTKAMRSDDARISALASEALFSLGDKTGLDSLIGKLRQGNEAERMEAAGFLATIEDDQAEKAVAEFLVAEGVAPRIKDAVSSNLKRARKRKN